MKNRLMSVIDTLGDMAEAHHKHTLKVDDMTRELMRRGASDPIETRKIAEILVRQAEITWKY